MILKSDFTYSFKLRLEMTSDLDGIIFGKHFLK